MIHHSSSITGIYDCSLCQTHTGHANTVMNKTMWYLPSWSLEFCILDNIQLFNINNIQLIRVELNLVKGKFGMPFPSPGDLPDPGIEPGLLPCLSHQTFKQKWKRTIKNVKKPLASLGSCSLPPSLKVLLLRQWFSNCVPGEPRCGQQPQLTRVFNVHTFT